METPPVWELKKETKRKIYVPDWKIWKMYLQCPYQWGAWFNTSSKTSNSINNYFTLIESCIEPSLVSQSISSERKPKTQNVRLNNIFQIIGTKDFFKCVFNGFHRKKNRVCNTSPLNLKNWKWTQTQTSKLTIFVWWVKHEKKSEKVLFKILFKKLSKSPLHRFKKKHWRKLTVVTDNEFLLGEIWEK